MAKVKKEEVDLGTLGPGNGPGPAKKENAFEGLPKGVLEQMQSISGSNLGGGYYNSQYDELDRLGVSPGLDDHNTDYTGMLASAQPLSEQLFNDLIGGTLEAASGLLSSFDYDIPDMAAMWQGDTKKYGSWLSRIANDLKEKGNDYPLYQDGDSFADPVYWMKMGRTLAYTGGLAAGGLAQQLTLSYATALTGGATAPLQGAAALRTANTVRNGLFGAVRGFQEGYLNGLETQQKVYQKYLQEGASIDEAIEKSAEAAAMGFKLESVPIMALNALQFGIGNKFNPFNKGAQGANVASFSNVAEATANLGTKYIKDKRLRGVGEFLIQGLSEGVEEGIQAGISKYAETTVRKQDLREFGQMDYFDAEMRDSIIGGVLGGFMFGAMRKGADALSNKSSGNQAAKRYEDFLSGVGTRVAKDFAAIQKAEQQGDFDAVEKAKAKMYMAGATESLMMDYANQSKEMAAFNSYLDNLRQLSGQEGVDVQTKANVTDAIAVAEKMRDRVFTNLSDYSKPNVAFEVAHKEVAIDRLYELRDRIDNKINGFKSDDRYYQEMSLEGRDRMKAYTELMALESLAVQDRPMTGKQKEQMMSLKGRFSDYVNTTMSNLSSKDAEIFGELFDSYLARHSYESQIIQERERIDYWKNPENIKKEEEKQAKKFAETIAKKANTQEEISRAKEVLQENQALDEQTSEVLDNQEVVVKAREELGIEPKQKATISWEDQMDPVEADPLPVSKDHQQMVKRIESIEDDFLVLTEGANPESESVPQQQTTTKEELPDESFASPAEVTQYTLQQETLVKSRVGNLLESLEARLGAEPTFKNFIADYIANGSRESADKMYNILIKGWELNGNVSADYAAVYNSLVMDPTQMVQDIESLGESIISSQEDQEQHLDDIIEQTEEKNANTVLDGNKRPVVVDTPGQLSTVDPTPKFANVFRKSEDVSRLDEDGTVVRDIRNVDTSLLFSPSLPGSFDLFIPGYAEVGSVFEVVIPDASVYENMYVQTWKAGGTQKGDRVKFKVWAKQQNLNPGDKVWNDKVPMMIRDTVTGKAVSYVHSVDWYNKYSLGRKGELLQEDIIEEGKENVARVRASVVAGSGVAKIRVTEKKMGGKSFIKTESDQLVRLEDNNPDSALAVFDNTGFATGRGEYFNEDQLDNAKGTFIGGATYEIRRMQNTDRYMAFPVISLENISDDVVETVYQSILTHINNKTGTHQATHDAYRKATQGISLYSIGAMEKALKKFVRFGNRRFGGSNADYKEVIKSATDYYNNRKKSVTDRETGITTQVPFYPTGQGYIFTQGGNIYFGRVRTSPGTNKTQTQSISPNTSDQQRLDYLRESIGNMLPVTDLDGLLSNDNVTRIDSNGQVIPTKTNYHTLLKQKYQTNVKSFKVGTETDPFYATAVNPVIQYELDKTPAQVQEEVAEKKVSGQVLTPQEERVVADSPVEVTEKVLQKAQEAAGELQAPQLDEDSLNGLRDMLRVALEENKHQDAEEVRMMARSLGAEVPETGMFSPAEVSSEAQRERGLKAVELSKGAYGELFSMSIAENGHLVRYLFNEMASVFDIEYGSKVNKGTLRDNLTKSLIEDKILPSIEQAKSALATTEKLAEKFRGNKVIQNTLAAKRKRLSDLEKVRDNWTGENGGLFEQAFELLARYSNSKEVEQDENGDQEVTELTPDRGDNTLLEATEEQGGVDYSQISLEENSKNWSSYRLRRFLAGIKDTSFRVTRDSKILIGATVGKSATGQLQALDEVGNIIQGARVEFREIQKFLSLDTYIGFSNAYDKLKEIINSPNQPESTVEAVMERMREAVPSYPWIQQVIDKLDSEQIEPGLRNEFVYNMVSHPASYKFVMFEEKKDGSFSLKVYDSNSGDVIRAIRKRWQENLKSATNRLTMVDRNGDSVINPDRVNELINEFETKFKTEVVKSKKDRKYNPNIKAADLKDWLAGFGIELSTQTLNSMRRNGLWVGSSKTPVTFNRMFEEGTSRGIYGTLYTKLLELKKKAENADSLEYLENEQNNPLNDIGDIGKSIARLESSYSLYSTTKTFRDGDKTFSGYVHPTHSTDAVNALKFNEKFRDQLSSKAFNKHSIYLKFLQHSEYFRNKFDINQLGNTAIKELNKKYTGKADITSLSETDHELVKLGMFMDMRQGEIKNFPRELGIPSNYITLREGRMFLPTMSDKSRMSMLQTMVLNVMDAHVNTEIAGEERLDSTLLDILYSQLVEPEISRIADYHTRGQQTNIVGYDVAAKLVNLLPRINELTYGESKISLLYLMESDPESYDAQWVKENMMEQIHDVINEYILTEARSKQQFWIESGFMGVNEKTGQLQIKYLDSAYLSKFNGGIKQKFLMGAIDYVVNSNIANANAYMLLAGDPAMYGKNSATKYFKDGQVWSPNTEKFGQDVYAQYTEDLLGNNIVKRLAAQVAPGQRLAQEPGETYLQLFLNDYIDHSTNIKLLTKKLDKKQITNTELAVVKRVNAATVEEETSLSQKDKDAFREIEKKYPSAAPFFKLEATDAQEYTTVGEHLRVLWGQNRITQNNYQELLAKIDRQVAAEMKGQPIPKNALFDHQELSMIFQPIKPVYAGFRNEKDIGVMRFMYIKSSSIPLLPQVTANTELDGLRRLMEAKEARTGKRVRTSYQSANKVGANSNALYAFDREGKFRQSLLDEYTKSGDNEGTRRVDAAYLELDRAGFRIQQDVPFDAAKSKVTMGSQVLKLLLGNGVTQMQGFEYLGQTVDGAELRDTFNGLFNQYLNLKRNKLFKEMGLDYTGAPIDPVKTKQKIQKLLYSEARERGYPRQDVEALEFIEITDSEGKVVDYQFKMPPWASPNSNKYESLLNAIVNNRLAKIKLPGNSYVVGSELGMQTVDNVDYQKAKSRVVYTSKWQGSLQAADIEKYVDEDGNRKTRLLKTQVLAPSKFRDAQGSLIELIYADGSPNPLYVERAADGSLRLKEDALEGSLTHLFTYRIPSSSHVSMSQVEITGFLPPEVGDLMIVPKNLTQQKGLDFDIDKETAYGFHHYVDGNGKISRFGLSQEWREDAARVKELYDEVKQLYYGESALEQDIARLEEELGEQETALDGVNKEDFTALLNKIVSIRQKLDNRKSSQADEETREYYKNLRRVYNTYYGPRAQERIIENKLVEVHMSVAGNPAMFNKISKVLSMASANEQATVISSKVNTGSKRNFSILSDTYQKDLMALGASGKLGIGVYSNAVVFNSMVQQIDGRVNLVEAYIDNNGKPSQKDFQLSIGGITSYGDIGKSKSGKRFNTLGKGDRSIAEVLAERQNTATDNVKEQIMGRVNVNDVTINFDTIMTLLGFDKMPMHYLKYYDKKAGLVADKFFESDAAKRAFISETKAAQGGEIKIAEDYSDLSISYAILSQPILREYVKRTKAGKGRTQGYGSYSDQDVIDELLAKYPVSEDVNIKEIQENLSGEQLFTNLNNPTNEVQVAALKIFTKVRAKSTQLTELQSTLNIANGGLGRSFFDIITKYENLSKFGDKFDSINNKESLIGSILTVRDHEIITKNKVGRDLLNSLLGIDNYDKLLITPEIKSQLFNEGYYWFQQRGSSHGTLIKPTMPAANMVVQAVYSGYNLWKDYLPYSNPEVLNTIDRVGNNILNKVDQSPRQQSETRQKIFGEMKKYFLSAQRAGFHSGNIQAERYRLFMDVASRVKGGAPTKVSLPTYLSNLLKNDEELSKNKLIGRFEFKLETSPLPSLIKYDNTRQEDFDEDYLYIALLELIEENRTLPDFAGKPYNTRQLAEDLVKYSYLGEPIQEAIQFIKYIPVSYLNAIGLGDFARNLDTKRRPEIFNTLLKNPMVGPGTRGYGNFMEQYAQNNAQLIPKLIWEGNQGDFENPQYLGKRRLYDLYSFNIHPEGNEINIKQEGLPYLAIYNVGIKKGLKKIQLYKRDEFGTYNRISVLGTLGLSEYQSNADFISAQSLVNANYIKEETAVDGVAQDRPVAVAQVQEMTVSDRIQSMVGKTNSAVPRLSALAETILPLVDNTVKVEAIDFRIKFPDKDTTAGVYIPSTHTIYMNTASKDYNNTDLRDKALMEEVIHSVTYREMSKYINFNQQDGTYTFKEKLSPEMKALKDLYDKARQLFDANELSNSEDIFQGNEYFTNERERLAYGVRNPYEFVAFALKEPKFQELLDVPYRSSGMTFLEKFRSIVGRIVAKLTGSAPNSLIEQTVATTLQIIENQSEAAQEDFYAGLENQVREMQHILDENSPVNTSQIEEPDTGMEFGDGTTMEQATDLDGIDTSGLSFSSAELKSFEQYKEQFKKECN